MRLHDAGKGINITKRTTNFQLCYTFCMARFYVPGNSPPNGGVPCLLFFRSFLMSAPLRGANGAAHAGGQGAVGRMKGIGDTPGGRRGCGTYRKVERKPQKKV